MVGRLSFIRWVSGVNSRVFERKSRWEWRMNQFPKAKEKHKVLKSEANARKLT
jgi:hypothetical protein